MWMLNFVKTNRFYLLLFLTFVLLGGFLLSSFSKDQLLLAVNSRHTSSLDVFFKYYTHVGDGNTYLIIAGCFLLFASKYKALLFAASYLFTSLPIQLIKYNIPGENFRPRAYFWNDYHRLHFVDGVEIMVSHSFPSGHTASAFSMFLILAYFAKNQLVSIIFFMLALLVGYSRMYLGQHFFADVYGGSIISVILTILVIYLMESVFKLNENQNLQRGLLK